MKLILGSASPRRLDLLAKLNINPSEIVSPNIDESIKSNELPLQYCKRIAHEKLKHFQNKDKDSVILTADTIAYTGRKLIDKTDDENIAYKNLLRLSGKRHRVSTSICIRNLENRIFKKTSWRTGPAPSVNSFVRGYVVSVVREFPMFDELWSEIADAPGEIFDVI